MESLERYEWTDDEGYSFYVDLNSVNTTNASIESLSRELLKLATALESVRGSTNRQ